MKTCPPATLCAALRAGWFGRKRGRADKLRFFNMAQGSLEECRYYLILTKDLSASADPHGGGEYGDVSEATQLLEEVSKLFEAYSRSILNSDS